MNSPIYVFFRDDDINKKTTNLEKLIDMFTKHSLPLGLAIEPGNLDKESIFYLLDLQKNSSLFELLQHGYKHTNYSKNTTDPQKFWLFRILVR